MVLRQIKVSPSQRWNVVLLPRVTKTQFWHIYYGTVYIYPKYFFFWIWVSMHTWNQAGLIKCILRALKTLKRAHLSWLTRKAPRQPVQLSACLTSSLWLLASCSSLTFSPFHLVMHAHLCDCLTSWLISFLSRLQCLAAPVWYIWNLCCTDSS